MGGLRRDQRQSEEGLVMSYIRAEKVEHGDSRLEINLPSIERDGAHTLDVNLDDEILQFVLALIHQVDELDEGEALVVWKEIF